MIDCIAGYHLNPWTCGIAKFNAILAKHLDVHVVGIRAVELGNFERPLLSVKLSEFSARDAEDLDLWSASHQGQFELFLHAFDGTPIEQRLVASAARVYVGNTELFHELKGARPDVQELFCPGTILNPQRFMNTDISVFTFGMAHKIRVPLYRRLHELLEATGQTYSVYVSTALHENTSFDGSFVVTFEELQSIFNGQVYFMGYLSDTAVFNHLLDSTYLAAFFEKGLRANNTTVNAAMECELHRHHQPRRAFARRAAAHDQRAGHQPVRSAAVARGEPADRAGGPRDRARTVRLGSAGGAAARGRARRPAPRVARGRGALSARRGEQAGKQAAATPPGDDSGSDDETRDTRDWRFRRSAT